MVLICCFTLVHASTLGTNYSPATAVSYSSIRLGAPAIENSFTPLGYETPTAPVYDSLLTTGASSIKVKTPTYTEDILPQYIPSGCFVPNLAKPIPASRNIPQSPSPEFDSVPSVLKTKGLSAFASSPIESLEAKEAPVTAKESHSTDASPVRVQPVQASTYSEIPGLYSVSSVERTERLSASSNAAQPTKVSYSESPVVSHVSVISSGTNYAWWF